MSESGEAVQPKATGVRSIFPSRLAAALKAMDPVPSQREIATRFNISPSAVNLWFKGDTVSDVQLVADLSARLGVSIDWLFGLQSDRTRIKAAPLSIVDYNFVVDRLQRRVFTPAERDALMGLIKSTSVGGETVAGEAGIGG
jgi:transcriptional regulator with XRE-family HTH domain